MRIATLSPGLPARLIPRTCGIQLVPKDMFTFIPAFMGLKIWLPRSLIGAIPLQSSRLKGYIEYNVLANLNKDTDWRAQIYAYHR